jgi:hypothetical protein
MSNFEDALCCCCCQEEGKEFSKPDLSRYATPIQWTNYPLDLVGNVDFDYEEVDGGVRVTQMTTPLIDMPLSMDCLSTRYFVEPPCSSPQDADLGKRDSGETSGKSE